MPFSRPDIQTLIDRLAGDIESRLPGTDARRRRSVLAALARAQAGAAHGLHGHLDWLARQLMPDTAETDHLERWASIWGVSRKPAAPAAGTVTFTGTDGSTIPAGTALARADGAEYTTDAAATIAAGVASVAVTATVPGAAGNAAAGTQLSLTAPVTGVQGQATVDAPGLAGGADTEDDASLRARLLARIREAPHGGNANDYVQWALEVPGVTRAWVYPQELGPGTVTVRFVADDDPAGPIPSQTLVDGVAAHIDALRPVTAAVTVVAPVDVPINPTIRLTPNDPAVQAAVQAELEDMLRREAVPGGTILLSHINEAISIAAGETDHALVSPTADVTHATGELAVLGTITWQ